MVTGGDANDFLVGGGGDDELNGAAGNDSFISGGGNDDVSGGSGQDRFIFASALNPATNVDDISDFSAVDDTIVLDDAFFAGLTPGALSADAFALAIAPESASERVVYNSLTGDLFFNANGGDRSDLMQFATLSNLAAGLSSSDFIIV